MEGHRSRGRQGGLQSHAAAPLVATASIRHFELPLRLNVCRLRVGLFLITIFSFRHDNVLRFPLFSSIYSNFHITQELCTHILFLTSFALPLYINDDLKVVYRSNFPRFRSRNVRYCLCGFCWKGMSTRTVSMHTYSMADG